MLLLIGLGMLLAPPTPGPVTELPAWLAGAWVTTGDKDAWTEEWWSTPRAGLMLGASRSGKGQVLSFFEHARIIRSGDGLQFCAMPQGNAGGCFPAISAKPGEIVFENRAHDYPTRIVYRKTDQGVDAEISGPGGSRRQSWRMIPLQN